MITSLAKRLMALTPYRVSRRRENRFDATHSCLPHLRELGYVPRLIIDGGAHLGAFSEAAHATFPEAEIHLIDGPFVGSSRAKRQYGGAPTPPPG